MMKKIVPGALGQHVGSWDKVLLAGHPARSEILPWVAHGVSVFDSLQGKAKRKAVTQRPFRLAAFPGRLFPNRLPHEHAQFVADEAAASVAKGCFVP